MHRSNLALKVTESQVEVAGNDKSTKMKEKDFDISVRNILENAEMPVSPKVWKGVSASMAPRKVVIPFWAYTMAGVAAAAAVAVGVFLHRSASVAVPEGHALVAEAPAIETKPLDATIAIPIEKQIEKLPALAVAKAEPSIARAHRKEITPVNAVSEEPVVSDVELVKRAAPSIVKASFPVAASVEDDNAALNKLAFSERKISNRFSINAAGDLQNNTRKPFSRGGLMAPSVKQVATEEGIYNATPEVAFGMPVAFGVGVNYEFSERVSVGTGLRYTWFSRTFVGDYYDADLYPYENRDIDNYQHWIGIPLNIYYDLISSRYWHFHTFAGIGAEFLLSNNYRVHHTPQDVNYTDKTKYPLLLSVGAGIGVEFKMSSTVGAFFDPSFRYYLNASKAPRSIRTVQPFCLDIEAGLRFYL